MARDENKGVNKPIQMLTDTWQLEQTLLVLDQKASLLYYSILEKAFQLSLLVEKIESFPQSILIELNQAIREKNIGNILSINEQVLLLLNRPKGI